MKCLKCNHDNRQDALFCSECGEKLSFQCPACGKDIETAAKFCDECGAQLTESKFPDLGSLEEKIDKIQRYLPQGLTEKILSQRNCIEGERKIVTVLFCDLVGYTRMVDQLDPEESYTLMDQVLEILIHSVHHYGGTVNQLLGDGLYALFGAPNAVEGGPQRAIRSAMEMHRSLTRFSDSLPEEKNIQPLRLRIGINTGPVVVGTIGNSLRVDFTAIGDTVNLASRMEGLAKPGTIYVTEETFKQTEHFFRFEALGEKQVKGKEKPLNVYQVIAPRNQSTRFDVSAEQGLTPLVGRDREMELLLDGFSLAKTGRGQVFSIVAEAGAGKSRLLYEFRKAVAHEDVTILEGKCLSYAETHAFLPIKEIVKSGFSIDEGDDDAQIRQKLVEGLKNVNAGEEQNLPYLLELLGAKETGVDHIAETPDLIKERIIQSVRAITIKMSELRPLIIIVEDLHWMDRNSEYLLMDLLENIPGSRVQLLLTYRPVYQERWHRKSYHNQVNINRFSSRETLLMLENLLATENLDRDLEELVWEKAGGIPFYIEELLKSLTDLSLIVEKDGKYSLAGDRVNIDIPASIQEIVMVRVDSLPEMARELVQLGSVIGREVSFDLIKGVSGLDDVDLQSALSIIKASELFYERGVIPDSTYVFRHALTRDVVFDSILSTKKQTLHLKTAAIIEQVYSEKIADYFELLSHHYISGGKHEKGAEFSKLAARKVHSAGMYNHAIDYAEKRITCLEKLPDSESRQKNLISARRKLGGYHAELNHQFEAYEAIEPIIELVKDGTYQYLLPSILRIVGAYYTWVRTDLDKAEQNFTESIQVSEQLSDYAGVAWGHYFLGNMYSEFSEFKAGTTYFEKALEMANAVNHATLIAVFTSSFVMGGLQAQPERIDYFCHISSENLERAAGCDERTQGFAYTAHAIACNAKGWFDEARVGGTKAISCLEKSDQYYWIAIMSGNMGQLDFELEAYDSSYRHFERGLYYAEKTRFPATLNFCRLGLERAKAYINMDIDLNMLPVYDENVGLSFYRVMSVGFLADIWMKIDGASETTWKWLLHATDIRTRVGSEFWLGLDCHSYARFYRKQNDIVQAKEQLTKAIDILKTCGADGWVKKYEEELVLL